MGEKQELQLTIVSGTVQLVGYEEWKKYLDETLKGAKNEVIDPNALKATQGRLAELRKVKKAINDERLAKEREYMQPFLTAKGQIADLITSLDEAITNLDSQVKAIQTAEDEKKKTEIEATWQLKHCGFTTFDKIWNERWLNQSYTIEKVSKEMDELIAKLDADIDAIILQAGEDEAKRDEMLEIYGRELDLGKTIIMENERIATRKAQAEALALRQQAQTTYTKPIIEPTKTETPKSDKWSIGIRFVASKQALDGLLTYIKQNNIQFTVSETAKKEGE